MDSDFDISKMIFRAKDLLSKSLELMLGSNVCTPGKLFTSK